MSNKILIIYSNPNKESFNTSIGKAYLNGLKIEKKEIKEIHLYDLNFDLRQMGYKSNQELEKDLKKVQDLIKWADHITFCYPIWWYNFPAILKGLFDRILISGFGFKYEGKPFPTKLLKGKTARALVTMDAPITYYKFIIGSPDKTILKHDLGFCGIKVIGHHYFGSVKMSNEMKRKTWLGEAYSLGLKE